MKNISASRPLTFITKISFYFCFVLAPIINNELSAQSKLNLSFSDERGFYQSSFDLVISSNTSDSKIKYTLDGSDPRFSKTALLKQSPAVINIDPFSTTGRGQTPGVIVRACAINNSDTSKVETHSYIFLENVKSQPEIDPVLGTYWPDKKRIPSHHPENLLNWMYAANQVIDLGVDPEITGSTKYGPGFVDVLKSIPTLSLVTAPESLFDPDSGIYINGTFHGMDWEKAGSLELINTNGKSEFQVNTGIRIRGGFSRIGNNPKHAFRLFFRKEYGDATLKYPLFKDKGVDEFDKIDLRSNQNDSWHLANSRATMLNDIFSRDSQRDMGQPYTRSDHYHLYINGMYWGLYQTQERPEASFGASNFGGKSEDYDVIKSAGPSPDSPPYTIEATDGNLDQCKVLWEIAKSGFSNDENYLKVLGLNKDRSRNPAYPILVDQENLIDYMIATYYAADGDGPVVMDGSGRINNFFGILNRVNGDGFKFFRHDAESGFSGYKDDINRNNTKTGDIFEQFNPMWLQQKLMENKEFKLKFADRVYKHLFGDGALTSVNNTARLMKRVDEINLAIIGESARWGDFVFSKPLTREDNWLPAVNRFKDNFIALRNDELIKQFQAKGWLTDLLPPEIQTDIKLSNKGVLIAKSGETFKLINSNGKGDIIYTIHGKDPREFGGNILSGSITIKSGTEITLSKTIILKVRIKNGESWSPLLEKTILVPDDNINNIKLTEINYHPKEIIISGDTVKSNQLEFIELKNIGNQTVDLNGYRFGEGIEFEFPENSIIKPGEFIVLASDTTNYNKLYKMKANGQFKGNLNDAGEKISLKDISGKEIFSTNYSEETSLFPETDGSGFSLVRNFAGNVDNGLVSWKSSAFQMGSPGKDDPGKSITYPLQITGILANSTYPQVDAIELYNNSDSGIDISNWLLSDDKGVPAKWKIPAGTVIKGKTFLVIYEGHYESDIIKYSNSEFGNSFSLSSKGETIYLYSVDKTGNMDGLADYFQFDATDVNTAVGYYTNKSGEIHKVQFTTPELGKDNKLPKPSPVVFKTINYNPIKGNFEYLVIKNISDSIVKCYLENNPSITWKIEGVDFVFPSNSAIQPGDSVLLVEKSVSPQSFREMMKITDKTQVYNFEGSLSNGGEAISIQKPIIISLNPIPDIGYVCLENVKYNDKAPWPEQADGKGFVLVRIDEKAYADDVKNWKAIYQAFPVAVVGDNRWVKTGEKFKLDGSKSYDPANKKLIYQWEIISIPTGSKAQFKDKSIVDPEITPDIAGDYLVKLKVSNSLESSNYAYISLFAKENRAPVASIKESNTIEENDTLFMDGSKSYDPDIDSLSYHWEIIVSPEGSSNQIIPQGISNAIYKAQKSGDYQIDFYVSDGRLNSPVKSIYFTVNSDPSGIEQNNELTENIKIFPNPTHSYIKVLVNLKYDSNPVVKITDLGGRLVYSNKFKNIQNGLNQINLDLSMLNMKSGIYFLTLTCKELTETKKIIFEQ